MHRGSPRSPKIACTSNAILAIFFVRIVFERRRSAREEKGRVWLSHTHIHSQKANIAPYHHPCANKIVEKRCAGVGERVCCAQRKRKIFFRAAQFRTSFSSLRSLDVESRKKAVREACVESKLRANFEHFRCRKKRFTEKNFL